MHRSQHDAILPRAVPVKGNGTLGNDREGAVHRKPTFSIIQRSFRTPSKRGRCSQSSSVCRGTFWDSYHWILNLPLAPWSSSSALSLKRSRWCHESCQALSDKILQESSLERFGNKYINALIGGLFKFSLFYQPQKPYPATPLFLFISWTSCGVIFHRIIESSSSFCS